MRITWSAIFALAWLATSACEPGQRLPDLLDNCAEDMAATDHEVTPKDWHKGSLGPTGIDWGPGRQSAGQSLQIGPTGTLYATVRVGYQDVLSATKTAGDTWRFEPLTESAGGHSMVVDSGGAIHVAYGFNAQGPYPRLHYGTNDGGSWTEERIHPDLDSGHYPEIVVDSSGVAYIAHSLSDRTLRVVRRSGEQWTELAGTSDLPSRSSNQIAMAFDSEDTLHLSYHDRDQSLVYAKFLDGQWSSEILATSTVENNSPHFVSIAIDGSSRVHIVYFDYESKSLMTLREQCGSWTKETVLRDIEELGDYWATMVVEESGVMHLAYVRDDLLLYMSDRSGSWNTETVSSGVLAGSEAIEVSDKGEVHLIYSLQDGDMMYATTEP